MSIEAMKQAFEALENKRHEYRAYQAITALRQAIEQADQQEPVAYLYHDTACAELANPLADSTLLVLACDRKPNGRNETPLYTAPPRKEWVGLTDEELIELKRQWVSGEFSWVVFDFLNAIEAKLKEKNT